MRRRGRALGRRYGRARGGAAFIVTLRYRDSARDERYVYSDRASMLAGIEPMIRGLIATEREELELVDPLDSAQSAELDEMGAESGEDLLSAWLAYQSEHGTVDEELEVDEGISR